MIDKKLNHLDFMKWEDCGHCGGKGAVQHPDGSKLRREREARGIGLREIAERLDLSASFISDIELGRRRCSQKTMLAYLAALKTDCRGRL